MSRPYDRVIEVIQNANQRGGRMMSVIDLLDAQTLTLAQLAWLLGRIEHGSGWLVGARPGGAGKTTVMCALMAMLPRATRIRVAAADADWAQSRAGDCVVAYEIGRGRYPGYLWGKELRSMCALGENRCRIVANLHADTLSEARGQIQQENGVSDHGMNAFGVFLPLSMRGGWGRRTQRVVERIDFWDGASWATWQEEPLCRREAQIAQEMEAMQRAGLVEIGSVRRRWLDWLQANPRD